MTSYWVTQKILAKLKLRDGNRCHYCGVLLTKNHHSKFVPTGWCIEHKTPRSKGGTDDLDNLVLACRRCNNRKRTMTYEEFTSKLELRSGGAS